MVRRRPMSGSAPVCVRESRGFTLIELLVVTAVLIAITGLMLANHSRFGGKILLENLVYDMALSIREAQVYGISVLRHGSGSYATGYGMRFAMSTPTSYTLYADAASIDGLFTAGETVRTFSIDRGYRIEKLCAPAGADIETCTAVSTLDILYKRPEPDAWISANDESCTLVAGFCKESARIGLTSPAGDHADFVVDINGQVSVNR